MAVKQKKRGMGLRILLCAGLLAILAAMFHAVPELLPYQLPPSPYTAEDFYLDGDFLACSAAKTSLGIDVSHHQGEIDWQAVADSGVEFAFIRLGYRTLEAGELKKDDRVEENLKQAKAAGLQIGAYFYSQAISEEEARGEAALALQILNSRELDLPLVFDWELETRNAGMEKELVSRCAIAFCEEVQQAGYQSMVYFNAHQAENLMDMQLLEDYPWWLAMYDVSGPVPCRMDVWQYTCTGRVPGIKGNVDNNLMFLKN